jgi:acetyl esterase/lipase
LRALAAGTMFALAGIAGEAGGQPSAGAAPSRLPLDAFFRPPLIGKPALSPDGRHLAVIVDAPPGGAKLAVIDLQDLGPPKVVAGLEDVSVANHEWVNDQRLVFDTPERQTSSGRWLAPGLWAVNRDGTRLRRLVDPLVSAAAGRAPIARSGPLSWVWRLHSVPGAGSNDVLVQGQTLANNGDPVDTRLARVDTMTGLTKNLSEGAPRHVTRWIVDRDGVPVIVTTRERGRVGVYVKSGDGGGWERWQDGDYFADRYADPVWVGFDGQVLALSRQEDGMAALHAVDPRTRKLSPQPLLALPGFDVRGSAVFDSEAHRLVGVHYEADVPRTLWLDPAMKATQEAVDAALPETVNRIECERCIGAPNVLVTAASDRQPPRYYVYNRAAKTLTSIAASRPWIEASDMGSRELRRLTARDGLSIPVLVTHPAGGSTARRPAVVIVHGGPWVRGTHWPWEAEAQFLASRGYVVIEPEFRGSRGFGFPHFRAGWKQWGRAMQDDVADAALWAVAQGWVDLARICIAGGSYGGYAVLMGLVRHHDLYRCGIDWVGVTDIGLMYTIGWSDISEEARGYEMPQLIGDPWLDAAQLEETSPLAQAAKVRRPLLLAYGGLDRRVPIEHGKAFRDAVMRTNRDVEWIEYPDEGHGWRSMRARADFWSRVERFLDRNIGAVAQPDSTPTKAPSN